MTAAIAVPLARASGTAPAPLAVQSASLQQSGQNLVWSVQMSAPFSPGALRAAGRSLCLLIEGVRDHQADRPVCASRGRAPAVARPVCNTGRPAELRGSVIAATVTRAGSRQLTATFLPSAIGNAYAPVRWQVDSTLGRPHCTSPTGVACATLWPAKAPIAPLHPPQPVGCTDTGPPFVGGDHHDPARDRAHLRRRPLVPDARSS